MCRYGKHYKEKIEKKERDLSKESRVGNTLWKDGLNLSEKTFGTEALVSDLYKLDVTTSDSDKRSLSKERGASPHHVWEIAGTLATVRHSGSTLQRLHRDLNEPPRYHFPGWVVVLLHTSILI